MSQVILLSLIASLNPTLIAATTVMLLLPRPAKLMTGYLLGALFTSATLGLVIRAPPIPRSCLARCLRFPALPTWRGWM